MLSSYVQKVAMGQISPVLGDVAANLERHLAFVREAAAASADVIVFPELGLTGYHTLDLTLQVARPLDHPDIRLLVDASREIDILFSFVEETDNHLFFISAVYASGGAIAHIHRKVYLPTYGMFDERRYFAAGERFESFASVVGKAGVLICEDAWHLSSPYLLSVQGATTFFVPASSPWRNVMAAEDDFGSHAFWRQLLQMYAQLLGVHIVFVNRVGYEDGVHFYGGSGVVSPDGEWLVQAASNEEALVYASVDRRQTRRARYTTPLVRDERVEMVHHHIDALIRGR